MSPQRIPALQKIIYLVFKNHFYSFLLWCVKVATFFAETAMNWQTGGKRKKRFVNKKCVVELLKTQIISALRQDGGE
jgi:hypothetical protein